MDTVLITGAKGKIGRWVIDAFRSEAQNIVGVDLTRPETGESPFGETYVAADVSSFGEISQVVTRWNPDTIVHLAAVPHAAIRPRSETFETNVLCAFNVFEAAAQNDAEVIWTSTTEVHGDARAKLENQDPPFSELLPLHPQNTYSLSKALGERMASYYARDRNATITTIRPSWANEPGGYNVGEVREWYTPSESDPSDPVNAHFWSYVDVRDIAGLITQVHGAGMEGHTRLFAVANDTYLDTPTADVVRQVFGSEPKTDELSGYQSAYSTQMSQEHIGWSPSHSWRDEDLDTIDPPAF